MQAPASHGQGWDSTGIANNPALWFEVLRVLKPGGHCVAFSGTRTYHRMACAIEDAGFEVRDQLAWCYGTGFPKSHDVSKGIDKAAGAVREKIAVGAPVKRMIPGADQNADGSWIKDNGREYQPGVEIPATDAARQWEGWGTALKPAWEPICLARKPLSEGTIAANVLRWGTGAINIDATRIPTEDKLGGGGEKAETAGKFTNEGWRRPWMDDPVASQAFAAKVRVNVAKSETLGRFPANLCHDGSQEVLDLFPESKGQQGDVRGTEASHTGDMNTVCYGEFGRVPFAKRNDSGSAARFFYCAKAAMAERAGSKHPTIKPIKLMQWLVRLITPPGGLVLDPFAGAGTDRAKPRSAKTYDASFD